ncbi:hypothetical protein, partial [Candidatus Frankia alpina]|uniref:hypothetical protein n=1 Tax=Candidatus Frankia alpina TaxID=2699483 RepID=UPI001967C50A
RRRPRRRLAVGGVDAGQGEESGAPCLWACRPKRSRRPRPAVGVRRGVRVLVLLALAVPATFRRSDVPTG